MDLVLVIALFAFVTVGLLVALLLNMRRMKAKEEECAVGKDELMQAKESIARLEVSLDAEKKAGEDVVKRMREQHDRELCVIREQHAREFQTQKDQHEEMRRLLVEQAEDKLKALKVEFENISKSHLKLQEDSLKASNKENVSLLLTPLRETINKFASEFSDNKRQQVETKTVIETLMRNLLEKTQEIGHNADELTKALKADPKKQGNWGEAVLKNILEASGLEEGREFDTQSHTTDAEGHRLIPDVVVHLPEKRNVIIDSKVSLTAYTAYMTTDDGKEREQLLKEHIASVRRHVKELAAKQYNNVVKNSIGYVLMFIPNDGSYILAMENDTKLATDAYRDHVIILNPTNLMMALQLVYHLWQSERQTKNVEDIYASAVKLYDKFVTFSDNFLKLGQQIDVLSRTYNDTRGQLSDGRGNIVRQLEQWKKKGMVTNKRINPVLLEDDTEDKEVQ